MAESQGRAGQEGHGDTGWAWSIKLRSAFQIPHKPQGELRTLKKVVELVFTQIQSGI